MYITMSTAPSMYVVGTTRPQSYVCTVCCCKLRYKRTCDSTVYGRSTKPTRVLNK